MKCKDIDRHIPEYLAGTLSGPDNIAFEKHLEMCASCARAVGEIGKMWDTIMTLPEHKPSRSMKQRFLAMLNQEKAYLRTSRESHTGRSVQTAGIFSSREWKPLLQGAVILVVFVLGLFAGRYFRSPESGEDGISELRSEIRSLREMMSLSLMNQEAASDRLQGISLTLQISDPDSLLINALIAHIRNDPNTNVRLAAVDALQQLPGRRQLVDHLFDAVIRQESVMVQIALIDALTVKTDGKTKTVLRELTGDDRLDPAARSHAMKRLAEIT